MQFLIGSLNLLAISTHPYIATIINLLAKYMTTPSKGHIEAEKCVLCYLKGTQYNGIAFHCKTNNTLETFVKFPINKIVGLTDANWGSQDQRVSKPTAPPVVLELSKSRSLSGFIIYNHGPIH